MTAPSLLADATPNADYDFDRVQVADPEVTARLEDDRERALIAARYASLPEIPAHALALLLGQSPRAAGTGPVLLALRAEIDAGRLKTADDIKTSAYGADRQKRTNWATVPIDRDDLREWLLAHGSADMRQSQAATWCGLDTKEQADQQ